MNTQFLFDNFDLIAQAPGEVAKLKETILKLAMQGKLVPQNPDDEPAEELIKRIQAEKDKLIAEGKLKKEKPLSPLTEVEKPYKLPVGWEWVRFANIVINRDGERIPVSSEERATKEKIYDYYGASGVIDKIDKYLFDKPLLLIGEDGANLINRSTPIAFIAEGKYWVNNHSHVLDAINIDVLLYLKNYINSISLESYVTGTAQPKMNQAKMNSIAVAFPPLAEQIRIVAKIDELFARCDALENEHSRQRERRQAYVVSSLHHLADAQEDTFALFRDQALGNLDTILATPEDVKKLRQAILTLAMKGKLVPQNSEEEPSAELLKRIKAEKEQLIVEGKLRKEKPLPPITEEEKLYEVPAGWEWVRLGDAVNVKSSKRIYESEYCSDGIPFFRSKEIGELGRGAEIRTEIYISKEKFESLKGNYGVPQKGDLLLTSVGSIGNTWISDGREFYYKDGNITQIASQETVSNEFIQQFIQSPDFRRQVIDTVSGTAYNALTIIKINNLVFPLPPLAEQHRIIAKIEELFAKCDLLETALRKAEKRQVGLMESVLHHVAAIQ